MRSSPMFVVIVAVGCHAAPRPVDAHRVLSVAKMDSVTARRICQSPDSVIAGTKDCVLLDQGRRGNQQFTPPPAPR